MFLLIDSPLSAALRRWWDRACRARVGTRPDLLPISQCRHVPSSPSPPVRPSHEGSNAPKLNKTQRRRSARTLRPVPAHAPTKARNLNNSQHPSRRPPILVTWMDADPPSVGPRNIPNLNNSKHHPLQFAGNSQFDHSTRFTEKRRFSVSIAR